MCARSPESQSHPGLHQNKHDQQVEGGDFPPLLCSPETSPRVMSSALGPQRKKDMDLLRAGPEEAHQGDRAL